jgi:hypothetical protein
MNKSTSELEPGDVVAGRGPNLMTVISVIDLKKITSDWFEVMFLLSDGRMCSFRLKNCIPLFSTHNVINDLQ